MAARACSFSGPYGSKVVFLVLVCVVALIQLQVWFQFGGDKDASYGPFLERKLNFSSSFDHLHIRSTFLFNKHVVSLVEISKELLAAPDFFLKCPVGPITFETPMTEIWLLKDRPEYPFSQQRMMCDAAHPDNHLGILVHEAVCGAHVCQGLTLSQEPLKYTSKHYDYVDKLSSKGIRIGLFEPDDARNNTNLVLLYGLYPYPTTPREVSENQRYKFCSMAGVLDSNSHFLDQWLYHQQYIGVERVFMYIVPDFKPTPYLIPLIASGYLTLVPWYERLNSTQIFYRSQILAYNDYAYSTRGLCEWTFFHDTDDFFVNFVSNHSLAATLQTAMQHANSTTLNELRFSWISMRPTCEGLDLLKLPISNSFLTTLNHSYASIQHVKHMIKTKGQDDIGIHLSPRTTGYAWKTHAVAVWHLRYDKLGLAEDHPATADCLSTLVPDMPQVRLNGSYWSWK